MKKHLQELGINDVEVTSAGISVVAGEKMCDAAKQLRPIDLKKDIIFITMTAEQKKCFGSNKNVFSLGELVGDGDILDPYGFGQDVYDKTAQTLWEYTNKLAQNLKQ